MILLQYYYPADQFPLFHLVASRLLQGGQHYCSPVPAMRELLQALRYSLLPNVLCPCTCNTPSAVQHPPSTPSLILSLSLSLSLSRSLSLHPCLTVLVSFYDSSNFLWLPARFFDPQNYSTTLLQPSKIWNKSVANLRGRGDVAKALRAHLECSLSLSLSLCAMARSKALSCSLSAQRCSRSSLPCSTSSLSCTVIGGLLQLHCEFWTVG